MRIGDYDITPVIHGTFALDGGAMFGIVPKPLWERKIPADERNRIDLSTRSLLIEGNGRTILIDTGLGDKWQEKYREIYKIDAGSSGLLTSLGERGLSREDITDVILTHLHFDHAGGATRLKDGEILPAFPNARYYVQKKHWEWARNPSEKDAGSFRTENFLPLQEHGVLELLDGETELFPHIRLRLADGHTPAQQLPVIHGGTDTLFYCGDLIPTHAHLSIPWVMGYDNHPLTTVEEKREVLDTAIAQNWILVFEHDIQIPAARVHRTEKGPGIREVIRLD